MATDHLERCVKELNNKLHNRHPRENRLTIKALNTGYEAAFELIDQEWDFTGDREDLIWREGYEQCMTDIVEAIAEEWGVTLPEDPMRKVKDRGDTDGEGSDQR